MRMITEKKFKNRRLISAKMGAYDFVYNIPEFMKRKRKLQCVILADKALKGLKCSVCKKTFDLTNKDEVGANRTFPQPTMRTLWAKRSLSETCLSAE